MVRDEAVAKADTLHQAYNIVLGDMANTKPHPRGSKESLAAIELALLFFQLVISSVWRNQKATVQYCIQSAIS